MIRISRILFRLVVTALLLAGGPMRASAEDLPKGVDPATGFRMDNYRAPTPETLPGGTVVDLDVVRKASKGEGYQLIDVYAKGVKADPKTGDWAIMEPRQQIPGSVWLPGVGFGALEKGQEDYFRRNLESITAGDKSRGLLFYCMSDCWHSWNASRRAILWGYNNVAWYPLGTDGWTEGGGSLVAVKPANFLGAGT